MLVIKKRCLNCDVRVTDFRHIGKASRASVPIAIEIVR